MPVKLDHFPRFGVKMKTVWNHPTSFLMMPCFWCHVPSWPGTVATFGHHRVDKYAMDCFGTYASTPGTASVHTLHMPKPNVTRVQSATQWTASVHALHMPKPVMQPVSKCYAMDCLGTCFTHAQTCGVTRVKVLRNGLPRYMLYTCPNLWCNPCQSATQWTASVHALHMPKPVVM